MVNLRTPWSPRVSVIGGEAEKETIRGKLRRYDSASIASAWSLPRPKMAETWPSL
jgi:hypothetical protein